MVETVYIDLEQDRRHLMDNKEIALKLTIEAIGEDSSIASVEDRLRLQKAVYLSQEMGIPLGYSYSWYVKGPYSPPLTQDYYNLNAAVSAGDEDTKGLKLHPDLLARAVTVRALLELPEGEQNKPNWYEALCSLHYLLSASRKDYDEAKEFMSEVKPHLNGLVDLAHDRLKEHGLV